MNDTDLQRMCALSPVHSLLGLSVRGEESGVQMTAQLDERFAHGSDNPTIHGGILATLLDSAASFALIALSEHDWTTVDLRVDYLRPVGLGEVAISGEVVRQGRQIGRARSSLHDASGRLCAIAIGSFVPVQ